MTWQAFTWRADMRLAIMVMVFLVGSSAASACGNPLIWAMLFAQVPEAKVVYEAELSARADGELEARVYEAKPGQVYHMWSRSWLIALAEEMQPAMDRVLAPDEALTILLADEVAALRFTEGGEPEFISAAGLRHIEAFDLVTTINALNGAWRHGLPYEKMIALSLISPGRPNSDTRIATIFSDSWTSKP